MRRLAWVLGIMLGSVALAGPHAWRVTDPAEAEALRAGGARLIADYGGFQVLEGDLAPDANPGGAQPLVDNDLIRLRAGPLDTSRPEVQSLRKRVPSFAGSRLHLVQFAGPVKPEWLAALRACGMRTVSYIPENAYLVYGKAADLARLQDWSRTVPYVRWDGDYAPEYRIDPRARSPVRQSIPPYAQTDRYAVQLLDDADVNPATLALIERASLAPVESEFRNLQFVNVIVRLPESALAGIASRPDVLFVQPYLEPRKLDERQDQIVAGNLSGVGPTGPGYLAWLASKGFTQTQFNASAFVVDVSDSGVDNGTTAPGHFGLYALGNTNLGSRVVYCRLEGSPNSGSTLQGCDGHGTLNAHIVAGYCAFSGFPFADSSGFEYGLGVCPFVKVGSSVVFDPDTFTYPSFPNLQSRAYHDGARISANSWGKALAGGYDSDAQTYDALVRDAQPGGSAYPVSGNQQMVIVFSAGNDGGSQTVSSPGTAKNVITVGAAENVRSLSSTNGGSDLYGNDGCDTDDVEADNANDMAGFSSRGPCADGRMKPDLVAPGTHVTGGVAQQLPVSTNGTGTAIACFDAANLCALPGHGTPGDPDNFFPLSQQFYTVSSGTSHAVPAVAGACALLRQYFINNSLPPPGPAMTKAYLMNSARYLNGGGANDTLWSPNQGMGALDIGRAFDGVPRILRDELSVDKFTATGQTRTFSGVISDPSKPLRVTLAWTDAPGAPYAAKELANDLDLAVTAGGVTYKGNVFNGAFSVAGGTADGSNNVESVCLPAGLSGNFLLTVTAANINSDGVPNESPSLDQDFALVVYNAVQNWVPVIALDNAKVTAENCAPTNGAIDPDETVTVAFALKNIGTENTTNLVVTLLQTNGVAYPSLPQAYGVLAAGGAAVTQAFSFTAYGSCRSNIYPVLLLQDGMANLGALNASFTLGTVSLATVNAANTNTILIPETGDSGPAWPYPSDIVISGVTNPVSRVTATLVGLSHTSPHDIDALLVGPTGTNVMLLSDCGYGYSASNVTLTFDSTASAPLPQSGQFVSGTYQPSGYNANGEIFPAPAPGSPFGQSLAAFNGQNPNGTWSLYVQDTLEWNSGTIAQGWQLHITSASEGCCSGAPLPSPEIQSIVVSNGAATVTWSAIPGVTYRLQFSGRLSPAGWTNTVPDIVATNFTATVSNVTYPAAQRYYRVLVVH